ncbi:MAG: GWxTD domain-containing protein [Cyclobacteriaceae bacterium]
MIQTLHRGLVVFLISCSTQVFGLDLTRLDLSFQYDVRLDTHVEYRIIDSGEDQYTVIYNVSSDTTGLWLFNILLQNTYKSENHDTLSLATQEILYQDEKDIFYAIDVPKSTYDLLIFSFNNLSEGIYRLYDAPLNNPGGYPSFYPTEEDGAPLLSKYYTGDEISFSGLDGPVHVFRYREEFGPADPPMGEMSALAPTLSIDSSYFVDGVQSDMLDFHFYLFQKDTLDNTGVTILKCPYYYPDLRMYDELIKPMRYISTSVENQSLNQAREPRKAFENFWLSNYGTKFRAKGAIRFFFQRVEEANQLFTDYKLGWKTDRGIIYVIYGKPDIVVKRARAEEWRYNSGERFEFIRIPILFTPSLYSLKRNSEYEKSWYNKVGDIRKGQ